MMKDLNVLMTLTTYTFFFLFTTLLNEYCLLFGTATNKIRRKKVKQFSVVTPQAHLRLQ